MTVEKATYSYRRVYEAYELVKALSIDCKRKTEHFSIACKLKEAGEKCKNLTGCISFDYEWNYYLRDYYNAAYNHKAYTKNQLDAMAKTALRYLQNELNGILCLMKTGEVNTTD